MNRFKKVELQTKKKDFTTKEYACILELVEACKAVKSIFQKQMYPEIEELQKNSTTWTNRERELFTIFQSPYDFLDEGKTFMRGVKNERKPEGSGFYPDNIIKEEVLDYLAIHLEEKKALMSPYTIVKRTNEGFESVPYHQAFKEEVNTLAQHLRNASELTDDEGLKTFLVQRALAVETDRYVESEMLWMDLSGRIELTLGPYEVYKDDLFGVKTTYEAFLAEVDEEETKRLEAFESLTGELEIHLPLAEEHKNFNRGKHSPIKIVNEIYSSGDCNSGVHFTAFNLPNDEEVRELKGSKKVMIKNIAHEKFNQCWIPIVKELFDEDTQKNVSFDAYFTHVLLHEISHGIGPGKIVVDGIITTVNDTLKETYSTLEEAKADLLGIYNARVVAEKSLISKELEEQIVYSFVAGIFRSIRFGINEAHGGANIIALNRLYESGAVKVEENKLHIDESLAKETLTELLKEILVIEAKGDYEAAKTLIEKERKLTRTTEDMLARLVHIPIDIYPVHILE